MENLYNQTGGGLSLKPEYQAALMDLCMTILIYFDAALVVAWQLCREFGSALVNGIGKGGIAGGIQKCGELVKEIKGKDRACQGFRVVVVEQEESDSDSKEAELEYMSDESRAEADNIPGDIVLLAGDTV
jgi:hypothetical protein